MATMTQSPAPEPDDIPDPDVPPDVSETPAPSGPADPLWRQHEALLSGFCQHLQSRMHDWMTDEHRAVMASLNEVYAHTRQHAEQVLQANEHALYSLGDAIAKMREEGIKVQTSPYIATVHATTPEGYSTMLTIQKSSAAELVEGTQALTAWLQQRGYTGVQMQSPA